MPIDVVPPKEVGEKYPATIFAAEPTEGLYGPQLKIRLIELNGQKHSMYMPLPATEKNRTGRNLKSLTGKYEAGVFDEQTLVGMTVDMVYAAKRGKADEVVLDLLKPRTPAKGEDVKATVEKAIAEDDFEAPF